MEDSAVKQLNEIVQKYHQPQSMSLVGPDGVTAPVLLLPNANGVAMTSIKTELDKYRLLPERRRGVARVDDLPSFILHVNRFKDDDSALFAIGEEEKPRLVAVLDYHRKTAAGDPRWGEHRTRYSFPLSDEWKTWAMGSKKFDQGTFAAFLEDHIGDVMDPAIAGESAKAFAQQVGVKFAGPQRMMELSRGISIRENVRVVQAEKLQSGEARIQFESEHQTEQGKPLEIPGAFLVAIPVFEGGDVYQVAVRLRYRVSGQSVVWYFEPWRTDRIFKDAFTGACAKAAEETGLPLIYGRPEPRDGKGSEDEGY